jgi:regulator of protease activity HflC (stomatin/prohibitin superfamily)
MVAAACLGVAACSNPVTDAGFAGYVNQAPMVFGHKKFIEVQVGPASTGLNWRYFVSNISITPFTADEQFEGGQSILSKDNLKIGFAAHLIFRVNSSAESIKEFIEKYNCGVDKNGDYVMPAYLQFIKEQFRTIARDEVQKYNGLDIKDNIEPISNSIQVRVTTYLKDSPFVVTSAVIGNIQYPEEVEQAVSKKLATTQILERTKMEIAVTQAQAQKRVAEAQGIAQAMQIINNQLSPLYLQHEAVEAQRLMVDSPNHTTIYIPVGTMGVPQVGVIENK